MWLSKALETREMWGQGSGPLPLHLPPALKAHPWVHLLPTARGPWRRVLDPELLAMLWPCSGHAILVS